MKRIINQEFGGERPLYCEKNLYLENVTIHAGESSLKETENITAVGCRFEGKYPFWCCRGFVVKDCLFTEGARAALWYSDNLDMSRTRIEAPKMFREMRGIRLSNVVMPNAQETMWSCRDIEIDNAEIDKADYIFMHSENIKIVNLSLNGNYSFQWASNIEIHDSVLNTKDAFWESDNVTVYDSQINGEFLAWHSRNLKLVRCHITGSQPLCYAENLILEDCTFGPDCDLAFEYSSVKAVIKGGIPSIKNPRTGSILIDEVGEVIIDANAKSPSDCTLTINNRID